MQVRTQCALITFHVDANTAASSGTAGGAAPDSATTVIVFVIPPLDLVRLVRSFVSLGAAVDCWQPFDVPSATASAEA